MRDRIVNVTVWCAALVYVGGRMQATLAAGDTAWGDGVLALAIVGVILCHVVHQDAPKAP